MTDQTPGAGEEMIWPPGQILVVCSLAAGFTLGGIVTLPPVSTVLFGVALVIFLLGCYRVYPRGRHPVRFEVGTYQAGHQYNGVEITAEAEIRYDDEGMKLRTVECTAVDEDGTTILRESDTKAVGANPQLFGLVGGDFDGAQSTTDHILAVATPVREYVDEWLAAEDNDMAIKTSLETEFGTTEPEIEQVIEGRNP